MISRFKEPGSSGKDRILNMAGNAYIFTMDVYDYAMKLEKDGEAYYREAAATSAHKGLGTILTMLADIEVEHYHIFERMKANDPVQVKDTNVLNRARNIFAKIRRRAGAWKGFPCGR